METETYKVAVDILNRFGDRQTIRPQAIPASAPTKSALKNPAGPSTSPTGPSMNRLSTMTPNRYAALTSTPVNLEKSLGPFRNPNANRMGLSAVPSPINQSVVQQSNLRQRTVGVGGGGDNGLTFGRPSVGGATSVVRYPPQNQPSNRLPFPIIDFDHKGVLEKMVDYLIGDGPSNRFAMICSACGKHNGMALEDEYCYKSYQCFYCNTVNPAKKLRPDAPALPMASILDSKVNDSKIQELRDDPSSSSSESSDDEDVPSAPNAVESEDDKNDENVKLTEEKVVETEEILPETNEEIQVVAEEMTIDNENANEVVEQVESSSPDEQIKSSDEKKME